MARDLNRELEETPDVPTTIWKPEPGDKLIGQILIFDEVPSRFTAGMQRRLVIETDEGDAITVYASHTVLAQELEKHKPNVGDRIAIQRLKNAAGKKYKRYRVIVDRASPLDVNDHRPEPEPEPELEPRLEPNPSGPVDDDETSFAFGANVKVAR